MTLQSENTTAADPAGSGFAVVRYGQLCFQKPARDSQ